MTTTRPATAQDIEAIYGARPPRSLRAFVFERDGAVLGCVGVYMAQNHQVMFFNGKHEEVRKTPVTAIKACKRVLAIAASKGIPLYAEEDPDQPGAERTLEHLGFERVEGRVFKWRA